MKRPLALIGLTTMLVLAVCFYADFTFTLWVCGLSFAGLIITLIVNRLRKALSLSAFFATVIVTVTAFTLFSQLYVKPLQQKYSAFDATVTATLLDEGTNYKGTYFYKLKVDTLNGEKESFMLSLSSKDAIMCKVGDKISFTADISATDYGGYLSDKIYLSASIYYEDIVKVTEAEKRPLYYYAVELRSKIRSALYLELDFDNAALATAVLLGDNSGFSDEISQNIRYAGLSHVTVVSGLHLSIITALYRKLFGKLIKNKYINAIATVLLIIFFVTLTGFGKSSIRAAIMLFVLILSGLFNREGDSLNALGLAAILLCVFNPYVVGDVGVLLSFSATFGIVAFSKSLEEFLTKRLSPVEKSRHKCVNKFLRKTALLFSTTFTAAAATLPVTIIFFGRVSLVQLMSNMVVLPFVQYFMIAAALSAVLHFIPYIGFVTDLCAFFADLIGTAMLKLTELFASIPMAYVRADYEFVFFWIFASLVLLGLIYLLRHKGKGLNLLCAVLSLLILISGGIGHIIAYKNTLTVYVTPSRRGQGVILCSNDGNAVLSCSGSNVFAKEIINVLEEAYTQNQLMVIASGNNTASENAEDILSRFDYDEILMYDTDDSSEHAEAVRKSQSNVTEAYGDYEVKLWNKATLSITERQGSVYQYLTYGDTEVLVLPYLGDAADVPSHMRSPDILITSGILDNMELLSFKTLVANGDSFSRSAVIDFYRDREATVTSVTDTIILDIVG